MDRTMDTHNIDESKEYGFYMLQDANHEMECSNPDLFVQIIIKDLLGIDPQEQ